MTSQPDNHKRINLQRIIRGPCLLADASFTSMSLPDPEKLSRNISALMHVTLAVALSVQRQVLLRRHNLWHKSETMLRLFKDCRSRCTGMPHTRVCACNNPPAAGSRIFGIVSCRSVLVKKCNSPGALRHATKMYKVCSVHMYHHRLTASKTGCVMGKLTGRNIRGSGLIAVPLEHKLRFLMTASIGAKILVVSLD